MFMSTYMPKAGDISRAWYVLDADGNPIVKDASGYKAIIQKFNILKEYFANTWGMDITKLREVILRRTAEVKAMDLETLK